MAALDFSAPPPAASAEGGDINVDELVSSAAMGKRSKDGIYEVADYHTKSTAADDDGEMDDLISRALSKTALSSKKAASGGSGSAAAAPTSGAFTSLFSRLTGGKTLEQADLRPVMDAMEKHLMAKNVAREVCEKVCEGVESRLLGKKLGALGSESTKRPACSLNWSDPFLPYCRRQGRGPGRTRRLDHAHPDAGDVDRPLAINQEAPLALGLARLLIGRYLA